MTTHMLKSQSIAKNNRHPINSMVIFALLFPNWVIADAIKLKPLNLATTVSTLAGTRTRGSGDNAIGISASFDNPSCVTSDGKNLYVAEKGSHKIRKIVISSGIVTTLAGTGFDGAVDSSTGTLASFNNIMGITTDGVNLYVADYVNHKIRKIVISSGAVTTFAGTGTEGAVDSNIGTSASFDGPLGITTDGTHLYVSDAGNQKIRKIQISSGAVSTLAGSGAAGANDSNTGNTATFNSPGGIITDGVNLYVADRLNHKIRMIVISSGAVSTVAGSGAKGAVDSTSGALASFNQPRGITTDGRNLYVADTSNHKIRKIVISSGDVTTLAGTGIAGSVDAATGNSASFNAPVGITTDGISLYVADFLNNNIRKIQ